MGKGGVPEEAGVEFQHLCDPLVDIFWSLIRFVIVFSCFLFKIVNVPM